MISENSTAKHSLDDFEFSKAHDSQEYLSKAKENNQELNFLQSKLELQDIEKLRINTDIVNNELPKSSIANIAALKPLERDEIIIKDLCLMNDGVQVLLTALKISINNTLKAATFFRKRATYEQEYAVNMGKLSNFTLENASPLFNNVTGGFGSKTPAVPDSMPCSFNTQWSRLEKIHSELATNRHCFSKSLFEMSENLMLLSRNTERSRKQLKENAAKLLKDLQDTEANLEKARLKFEYSVEDLEGSTSGVAKKGFPITYLSLKHRIQQDLKFMQKSEVEQRERVARTNANYNSNLQATNNARKAYQHEHLPRLIRALKQVNEDCQNGLNKYLVKFARSIEEFSNMDYTAQENTVSMIEQIDSDADFDAFLAHASKSPMGTKLSTSEFAAEINPSAVSNTYFGSTLATMMERSNTPIPGIVINCIEYIEASGLKQEGLYRVSGSTGSINQLRALLDDNPMYQLENVVQDVHAVTGVLKLFFRELSEPLFPRHMFKDLITASKIEDDTLKLIKIHEQINQLHDAHYASLKYLACHLSKVASFESSNKMSLLNLGIVWGPSLLDSPDSFALSHTHQAAELKSCSKILEIIVANVNHIFEI